MKTTTKTPKATISETRTVARDYGMAGTLAIIDHPTHGRLLIEDGFGGMDSLEGGCVRWKHGAAYQLQPGDTFEALDEDLGIDCMTRLSAIVAQLDDARPWLAWNGHAVASLARSLRL